jgi:hypothetical protein
VRDVVATGAIEVIVVVAMMPGFAILRQRNPMPTAKEQAAEVIKQLNEDCTIEEIQYRLFVADKIRRRLETADAQPPISHEDVKRRMEKWIIK